MTLASSSLNCSKSVRRSNLREDCIKLMRKLVINMKLCHVKSREESSRFTVRKTSKVPQNLKGFKKVLQSNCPKISYTRPIQSCFTRNLLNTVLFPTQSMKYTTSTAIVTLITITCFYRIQTNSTTTIIHRHSETRQGAALGKDASQENYI